MKFKIFLALGVMTFIGSKAYLWANDTTLTQEVEKAKETFANYVENKKEEAIVSVKTSVKKSFEGLKETVLPEDKNKPTSLYEIQYKYDSTGAPSWIKKSHMEDILKEASDVWEKACGIKFTNIGTMRSDYVNVDEYSRTHNKGFGLVRWSEMAEDKLGQAHLGSENGPVKNFVMDLNSTNFDESSEHRDYLFSTVVHEFGHVLGLPHSRIQDSVMYYSNGSVNVNLNDGDKEMCRDLVKSWDANPNNKKIKLK